ncbi:MAG: PhzF family phenazine biosynthesis protein [Candidatus Zixiibacteriota bacterium]|jgi:PhzF family phenazine biosynthesis protein
MAIPVFQVDAFTEEPFAGNPAAVCPLDGPADEAWMQHVGREMNLSETAFLYPVEDGYNLRWFTPAVEVDLCGHATLATAHILFTEGYLPEDREARFHTKSGLLTAKRNGEWIELDFPGTAPEKAEVPPGLLEALGVTEASYVGRTRFDYFVEAACEDVVRSIEPDPRRLRELNVRGVMVTAAGGAGEFDFVSRFFAPGAGIDEDPVTGSAHCALGPHWGAKLGKDEMLAFQASARGGVVRVTLAGDRVKLGGKAVTVLRGNLIV